MIENNNFYKQTEDYFINMMPNVMTGYQAKQNCKKYKNILEFLKFILVPLGTVVVTIGTVP